MEQAQQRIDAEGGALRGQHDGQEQEPELVNQCQAGQARKRSRLTGHTVEAGVQQEEPMRGVDLPPAGSPQVGRQQLPSAESLPAEALAVLARQDAASQAQYLKVLRFDDQLAELAGRRGLLVTFHIRTIASGASAGQAPELVVEAPEFMTVEYLKRRIAKAKLLQGQFLSTSRFRLRRRRGVTGGGSGVGRDAAAAGAQGGQEDVPACQPNGDEFFLLHLGYEAPGPYQVFIASATQTTDREQQEGMLSDLLAQSRQRQQAMAAAAAAAAAAGSTVAHSPELLNARLSYQALLSAPATADSPQQQQSAAGVCAAGERNLIDREAACAAAAAATVAARAAAAAGAASINRVPWASSGGGSGVGAAGGGNGVGGSHANEDDRTRRHVGRWSGEEVAALIEGVLVHHTSWATIYDSCVAAGRINPGRKKIDLKDKWRNLVKLATDPSKQARSVELSDEQRQVIWGIVLSNNGEEVQLGEGGGEADLEAVERQELQQQQQQQQQQVGVDDEQQQEDQEQGAQALPPPPPQQPSSLNGW